MLLHLVELGNSYSKNLLKQSPTICIDITTARHYSQRKTTVERFALRCKQRTVLVVLHASFFIFHRCHKNRFCIFVAYGENEYRQKAFRSPAEKWCGRYPGGFQRRAGEACLWHTILLARSSVLYLLFREAGKGVMSPFRTAHLYPPKTAAKNCEGMSRVWLPFS